MTTRKTPIRQKSAGSYHHGDLKTSLKEAALRLVREKGPRGFSLNEASRLAGVSVGAPYRHFPDKDALLAEIASNGNELLTVEITAAAKLVSGVKEKMIACGMAYLEFCRAHPDYFAVIFHAGLDKSKYPAVEQSARNAFGTIFELALAFERTPELAMQRAVSCWALVHGLASLRMDGGLAMMLQGKTRDEPIRYLLELFLDQPYE